MCRKPGLHALSPAVHADVGPLGPGKVREGAGMGGTRVFPLVMVIHTRQKEIRGTRVFPLGMVIHTRQKEIRGTRVFPADPFSSEIERLAPPTSLPTLSRYGDSHTPKVDSLCHGLGPKPLFVTWINLAYTEYISLRQFEKFIGRKNHAWVWRRAKRAQNVEIFIKANI